MLNDQLPSCVAGNGSLRCVAVVLTLSWLVLASSTFGQSRPNPGPSAAALDGSWQQPVGMLIVHPLDPRRIYLLSAAGAMSRSEDGGESWLPMSAKLAKGPWQALALWDQDPLTLYVLNRDGALLFSDDGGDSFEWRGQTQPDSSTRLTVDPGDPWTLFADGQQGLRRSRDGGETWETVFDGQFVRLAIDGTERQHLVLAACLEGEGEGPPCRAVLLNQSEDGGDTWEQSGSCNFLASVESSRIDKLQNSQVPQPIHQLLLDEGRLFLATWLGLFESSGSGSICPRRSEMKEVLGLTVEKNDGKSRLFWLERRALRTLRGRHPFTVTLIGERPPIAVSTTSEGFYLLLDDASVIVDRGAGWQRLRLPLAVDTRLHDGRERRTSSSRRQKKSARGVADPLKGLALDNHIGAVLFHPKTPGTLFVGSLKGVFVSEDFALTWQRRNEGLWPSDVHVLAFDATHDLLYAGTHGGGIYLSADEGRTWQRRSRGLSKGDVTSLWVDPEQPSTLLTSVGGSVFISRNSGRRWRSLGSRRSPHSITASDDGWSVHQEIRHALALDLSQPGAEEFLALPDRQLPHWLTSTPGVAPTALTDSKGGPCHAPTSSSHPEMRALRGRQLLLDSPRKRLYLATEKGVWSTSWQRGGRRSSDTDSPDLGYPLGRQRARCGGWTLASGSLNVQSLAVDPADGTLFAATSDGLWALRKHQDWQRMPLPDASAPIHSVAVDASSSGLVLAGDDRGGVYLSLDGGTTWRESRLPKAWSNEAIQEALRPSRKSLAAASSPDDRAAAIRQVQAHLRRLPASAHRENLRWQTELWGRLASDRQTGAAVSLGQAVAAVRRDAVAQLRSSGLQDLRIEGDGRWLIANYTFDDGSSTHDERRIFDLHTVRWRDVDRHEAYGSQRSWKTDHLLALEPPHLLPAWQLIDAGDLLATSSRARALVTRRQDGEIVLWSLRQEERPPALPSDGAVRRPTVHRLASGGHAGVAHHQPRATFSDDGRWLMLFDASTSKGRASPQLWRLEEEPNASRLDIRPFGSVSSDISSLVFHPSSDLLLLAKRGGGILSWSLQVGHRSQPEPLAEISGRFRNLTFSPEGDWLAAIESLHGGTEPATAGEGLALWPWKTREGEQSAGPGERHDLLRDRKLQNPRFDAYGRWLTTHAIDPGGGPHVWDLSQGVATEHRGLDPQSRLVSFLEGDRVLLQGRDAEIWQLTPHLQLETKIARTTRSKPILGGQGFWLSSAAKASSVHGSLAILPRRGDEYDPSPILRRLDVDLPRDKFSAFLGGPTLILAEGMSQLELWRFRNSTQRARIQIGRYGSVHDDARLNQDAYLDLLELLPSIELEEGRREVGPRLCHLAGGAPSRSAWHQVLPKEPYEPFCRDADVGQSRRPGLLGHFSL